MQTGSSYSNEVTGHHYTPKEELELKKVTIRLGRTDRGIDLGLEDVLFIELIGLRAPPLTHEGFIEREGTSAAVSLLGVATIKFVTKHVLGDRKQPGTETCAT